MLRGMAFVRTDVSEEHIIIIIIIIIIIMAIRIS
jgi:hypothetical protein